MNHRWYLEMHDLLCRTQQMPKCFPEPCCVCTSSCPPPTHPPNSILKIAAAPPLYYSIDCTSGWSFGPALRPLQSEIMKLGLAALLCLSSLVCLSECAPPTCYSRALDLSKEIMTLLDKIHTYHRTVSKSAFMALSHLIGNSCLFEHSCLLGCRKPALRFCQQSSLMCT